MRLEFFDNEVKLVFDVDFEGRLSLMHFSCEEKIEDREPNEWYTPFEIHVSGGYQKDNHGAKHTATSGSKSLRYVNHNYYDNEYGKKLEIEVKDDELNAVLHYQFYNGIKVVRGWCEVFNISNEKIGIEYITSLCIPDIVSEVGKKSYEDTKVLIPHSTWCRELDWHEDSLTDLGLGEFKSVNRINIHNSGTWSSKEYLPMGLVINAKANEGYFWQIENNGSWQWEIGNGANTTYLKLSGPTESENHWFLNLKPGDSFKTVSAAIVCGGNINELIEQMTLYRRKIVRKNVSDEKLPVIFNDYMNCLFADPTTEKEIPLIDMAAKAGAEYYCMDAGWYAEGKWWDFLGEWQPCEARFKNGIIEVFDYIRSKGMIPGIWLEIEDMGLKCPILDDFSDDCFFMRHGKRVIDNARYQLDFRNEKVRAFATSVVDRVVNEFGVGYIKMDYNIDAGIGTEVNADSFGDGLLGHNRAYIKWMQDIMDKYPKLIVENCSSGGMRMDYALLSIHSIQSITDQMDYKKMPQIAAAASTAVLPEQGAMWTYPMSNDTDNGTIVNMINAMLMRMHLSGQITNLREKQFSLIQEGIECYKNIREDIKKGIHFYPDGIKTYGREWLSMGLKLEKCMYLAVWRMNSDENKHFVPISVLNEVQVIYPKQNDCCISKKEDGIEVMLPEKYSAVLIKIN